MKLWLSKNSEVSLHEQLTRQIIAAISSEDLRAGDKLPSVRELALRFKVHQNTISSAYRRLEENGWVVSRKGSGVFVRELARAKRAAAKSENENELDLLISDFFGHVQRLGYTNSQVEEGLKKFLANPKPDKILIAERDEYLRQIIFAEIQSVMNFPTFTIDPDRLLNSALSTNSIVVALRETAEKLSVSLPSSSQIISLKINSAQIGIQGQQRPQIGDLIGIVSGWEMFLRWAKTFLIAVGIDAENIVLRDARQKNFQRGLQSCAVVISDSATAQILPKSLNARIFRLVAEDSLAELISRSGSTSAQKKDAV